MLPLTNPNKPVLKISIRPVSKKAAPTIQAAQKPNNFQKISAKNQPKYPPPSPACTAVFQLDLSTNNCSSKETATTNS
ncbi:hypothetical protein D6821_00970, partial [Candidatus Parcubacteria bacterium]